METFNLTINQMGALFSLIAAGYLLGKLGILPPSAAAILSKLENKIFVPALIMGNFIRNFNLNNLTKSWQPLVLGLGINLMMIPIGIFIARRITKDSYCRNIYSYGLIYSNYGYMGNAVVAALYPDVFYSYIIFTMPFQIITYLWAVPTLLVPSEGGKSSLKARLKSLFNPMFIAALIGMAIGISGLSLPAWLLNTLDSAAGCMSPIAMLLTGITVAAASLKTTFTDYRIYLVSAIRLLIFPLLAIGILWLLPLKIPAAIITCIICFMAMPLGLNPIVIPGAYGKDTTPAAGMAILSHLLSCITIPLIIMLMTKILL